MHSLFLSFFLSFLFDMQPQVLQCPGVSRPLKVLTGKESVHQRVVVSKQAAAASPRVRGCMFDVTSWVEVASLLRPAHCRSLYLDMQVIRNRMYPWKLVCLESHCKSLRNAKCAHASVWNIKPIWNTPHFLFGSCSNTHRPTHKVNLSGCVYSTVGEIPTAPGKPETLTEWAQHWRSAAI